MEKKRGIEVEMKEGDDECDNLSTVSKHLRCEYLGARFKVFTTQRSFHNVLRYPLQ